MTAVVVADHAPPPPDLHPVPARAPQQRAKPASVPAAAVTLQVTLCHDMAEPVAALRELVERIGAITDLIVLTPIPIVDARPADAVVAVPLDAIRLDVSARAVSRDGEEIALCRREFDLLAYLTTHAGQVFTRGQLLNAMWEDPFIGPRTIDVHIRRLRQKLGTRRPLITTVRGVGYRLATDALVSVVPTPTRTPHATDPTPETAPVAKPPLALVQRGAALPPVFFVADLDTP
jgi:two-component system OmpR family response regulator